MATENLGKVSLTMGGNYSPTASYARLTVVRGSSGNSYVSKTSVAGVEPGVDPGWEDYWQILALDGTQGGDDVSWEQTVTTGTKIAAITINGTETEVYAPAGGGGGVQIDDNAGAGATTVAWSANKIVTELAGKQASLPSGSAGQVLARDAQGNPVWITPDSVQVSIITNPATTLTLQPCPVTYKWGEVAELTLTVTATTEYHFMFTCPSSAATVLTITGETQRTGDTLEAGKTYEVDIWAGVTLIREVS